jgi:hypothetical protein
MSIMLGNLTVSQIEERLGIEFPEEIRTFMIENHQPKASSIAAGKWHCFDIPFNLVCGDVETATKIFNSVKARARECKESMLIGVSNANVRK